MPYIAVHLANTQPLSESQTQQLVQGITDVMVQTLGKKRHLVAVSMDYLPPTQWFIAAQTLATNSAFIQAYLTEATNSEAEKAQAIAELHGLLQTVLGKVEEATYIVLNNLPATDWGYAGKTQAQRYLTSQTLANDNYQFYVQRAHALQRAEVDALFLKLANLVKRVFRFCIVGFFTKMFSDRSSSAKRLKSS